MNIALWIVQVLLALFFLMAGSSKLMTPVDELAQQMGWVNDFPTWLPTFIGAVEVLGALGLILPAATRIQPILTALAADGLATIMLLAAIFHISRGEFGPVGLNVVLLLLAGFVAYGRWKLAPIAPRSG